MNLSTSKHVVRAVTRGFTLVEMLVVITVIALLIAIMAPSFFGTLGASRLTQGGDELLGELSMAQQSAIATGRPVEVRFYSSEDPNQPGSGVLRYRSFLILDYYQPGQSDPRAVAGQQALPPLAAPIAIARTPLKSLGNGVLLADLPEMSTIISAPVATAPTAPGSVVAYIRTLGGYQEYALPTSSTYVSFIFYPESTSLNTGAAFKWFLTLVDSADIGKASAAITNFYTIQIDPSNGRLTSYRP